jgi:transposase InsO family protein
MARNNSHQISQYDWILDSATTSHICAIRDAFIDYIPLKDSTIKGLGDPVTAHGRGTVIVNFAINGNTIRHQLRDVLHVPDAPNCLLSIPRIDEAQGHVEMQGGECIIKDKKGIIIGKGSLSERLYILEAQTQFPSQEKANYTASNKLTWDQWHRLYGHIAISSLEQLDRDKMVDGMAIDHASLPSRSCEACIKAKHAHAPFPKEAEHRSETAGERVMSDVWGKTDTKSSEGYFYYISFTDDAKRFSDVKFMVDKKDAVPRIKDHAMMIERKFGKFPKWMRFDNGTELVNAETKAWAGQRGIELEVTAPYSQSQNGVAERFNRTHMELARAMLFAKGLPEFLWDQAVAHANYLRNRAPTRALKGLTPYEAWHGHKPDVSHLREFGCDVWILDKSKNRSKLHPRSHKMIFVGFDDGAKCIRYYDKATRRVKRSRNFKFNENEEARIETVELPGLQAEGEKLDGPPSQTTPTEPETRQLNLRHRTVEFTDAPRGRRAPSRINKPPIIPSEPPDITRSTESSRAKSINPEQAHMATENILESIFRDATFFSAREEERTEIPITIEDALNGEEADQWKKAIDEELDTLKKMGTWELADLPEGRKPIGCKWVFVKKRDEKGKLIKYKAWLVAQGFSQKPGVDFSNDGTFAPVMRFETLRTFLAFAASMKWDIKQFDVKGAYLHGLLKELIFMDQPRGFDDGSGRVCKLIRTLYGLRQAGNVWNREFNAAMKEIGFIQLKADPCCYLRHQGKEFDMLLVWVDDIISIASNTARNDIVEQDLGGKFEIKALGRPKMLLGMGISQNPEDHSIKLFQTAYVDSLLKKHGLEDANPVSTPMDPNTKLDHDPNNTNDPVTEGDLSERASASYATLIGSLMYLAIGTRPDIAYSVQRLAQFTQDPKPVHWTAVKRIFRYLKGTRTLGLTYGGGEDELNDEELNIYCDADWASDADRKSVSGYVITLAGGAVAWSSKKQSTVALSTAEAEYVAATHCAKQVIWHRSLLTEVGLPLPSTSTIFSDNQAAVSIAHHPEHHARTKHINIAHHFLRDLVQDGVLNLVYIKTEDNLADIFTKPLPKKVHQDLTYEIGIL